MQTYANRGGDSGVIGYEIGSDSITVYFKDGAGYLYTNTSTGVGHIAQMQALAKSGQGLNGYINRYVRKAYARKL